MKIIKNGKYTKIWLSANDTYNWTHRTGKSWPCSTLSDKRLFIELEDSDLVDLIINGKNNIDCDAHELNAMIEDFLK